MLVETKFIGMRAGKLEVQVCNPSIQPGDDTKSPLLFLHGANCAASCYKNLLPYFAEHGFPSYALSLRGHGASFKYSWFWMMFMTTLDDFVHDLKQTILHVEEQHGTPPILIGHSFGGGILQYALSNGSIRAPGLVLLGAAPLTGGGKEIMENWQKVEAPQGYAYPWSPRTELNTTEQVRKVFFSPECDEVVISEWLRESKPPYESAKAGLSVPWPFGTAEKVLKALDSMNSTSRKILCISGGRDVLVTPEMVTTNAALYREIASCPDTVKEVSISESAHHFMLDVGHLRCAEEILRWLTSS